MRAAVLVVLAACGRIGFDATSVADSGSGAEPRIGLRWYVFDTARSFAGFYDRQRAEICIATPWTDGVVRCTPPAGNAFYRDAGCTMPIGASSGAPPPYFAELAVASSRTYARVFTPGAATTATQMFQMVGGACSGPISTNATNIYELTELPPDTFASVELSAPVGNAPLAERDYITPDGAHVQSGILHDRDLGLDCHLDLFDDDAPQVACAPLGTVIQNQGIYSDATCSQPIIPQTGALPPAYVSIDGDGCIDTPNDYYQTGAAISPPFVYINANGTCAQVTDSGPLFALGPQLAVQLLPHTNVPTGSHLENVTYGGHDIGVLYDPSFGASCFPQVTGDAGLATCEPIVAVQMSNSYSDAGCTTPISIVYAPCNRPLAPVVEAEDRSIHAVGAQYAGPVYLSPAAGSCTQVTPTTPVFTIGAPVDIPVQTGQLVIE